MTIIGNEQLAKALNEALHAGEAAAPVKLMTVIADLEQPPFQALQDMYQAHNLLAAFDEDFGFIRFSFSNFTLAPNVRPQSDRARYVALLRWLIGGLRQWRRADDPNFQKLVTLLVVARVCDLGNALWPLLPDDIGANNDLVSYLRELVASFDMAFTTQAGATPPIWESELVEKFQRADDEYDWATILSIWLRFPIVFGNMLQMGTVRFLYRYNLNDLVLGLSRANKTPVAIQLVGALAPEQGLRVALASVNPHVRFAAAYRTLADSRGVMQQNLALEQEGLLTELLVKAADDSSQWPGWMKALARYPALQRPLGNALSRAPESALSGYINSLCLLPKQTNADPGRRSITECLRAFYAAAPPERRAILWRIARERWNAWAFDTANPSQHLMTINWSDLDYAIVGYALECMDDAARNDAMIAICKEMETLEHRWHASQTDIITTWYRLLSQFQPYAHAVTVASKGGDWLQEAGAYGPQVLSQSKYLALMYNMTA